MFLLVRLQGFEGAPLIKKKLCPENSEDALV
jgi:hypothetical protein